jgi:hypothetical protein
MKMSDMRAKARAIFGPAIAEPMPKQPNGAKALQERANARPIPTYKVGGAVKKSMPPQPTAADREADRKRREEYAKMKPTKEQAAAITRGNRAADIEGGRYKDGGKVRTSADTAKKLATEMGGMKKGGAAKVAAPVRGRPMYSTTYNPNATMGDQSLGTAGSKIADRGMKGTGPIRAKKLDPNFDVIPSAPKMGGMKKGGKAKKDGLAVMIAIGEPKKPMKKAAGGAAKVRKGMMTPEGKITHAMNKMRDK